MALTIQPSRVQGLQIALGSAAQVDVATKSPTFVRFLKLNMDVPYLRANTENDAAWIGKGHEFISNVYKTNKEPAQQRIEKYGSSEFMLWAWGYALGEMALGAGLYTMNPIDPGTQLERPYWSMATILNNSGGTAVDEVSIGNSVDLVETRFTYGPNLATVRTTVDFSGNGISTLPSGVAMPAVLAENYMLSSSMTITVNGVDYVAGVGHEKTALMGTISWNNNPILAMRYHPGSGLDADGFAVGDRIFIGVRQPVFTFTAFLTKNSNEYANLVAQTTGTAAITFTFDATHTVTFTFHKVSFELVERVQEEGIVAVTVTVAVKSDDAVVPINHGLLTVTGKCGIADIGQ